MRRRVPSRHSTIENLSQGIPPISLACPSEHPRPLSSLPVPELAPPRSRLPSGSPMLPESLMSPRRPGLIDARFPDAPTLSPGLIATRPDFLASHSASAWPTPSLPPSVSSARVCPAECNPALPLASHPERSGTAKLSLAQPPVISGNAFSPVHRPSSRNSALTRVRRSLPA